MAGPVVHAQSPRAHRDMGLIGGDSARLSSRLRDALWCAAHRKQSERAGRGWQEQQQCATSADVEQEEAPTALTAALQNALEQLREKGPPAGSQCRAALPPTVCASRSEIGTLPNSEITAMQKSSEKVNCARRLSPSSRGPSISSGPQCGMNHALHGGEVGPTPQQQLPRQSELHMLYHRALCLPTFGEIVLPGQVSRPSSEAEQPLPLAEAYFQHHGQEQHGDGTALQGEQAQVDGTDGEEHGSSFLFGPEDFKAGLEDLDWAFSELEEFLDTLPADFAAGATSVAADEGCTVPFAQSGPSSASQDASQGQNGADSGAQSSCSQGPQARQQGEVAQLAQRLEHGALLVEGSLGLGTGAGHRRSASGGDVAEPSQVQTPRSCSEGQTAPQHGRQPYGPSMRRSSFAFGKRQGSEESAKHRWSATSSFGLGAPSTSPSNESPSTRKRRNQSPSSCPTSSGPGPSSSGHLSPVSQGPAGSGTRAAVRRTGMAQAGGEAAAARGALEAQRSRREKGRDPVQLLADTARAVASGDGALLRSLLSQLDDIASRYGDAAQRVASYCLEGFESAIQAPSACLPHHPSGGRSRADVDCEPHVIKSFQALMSATPLVSFGHVASNSCILEATAGSAAVYIIDLGTGHGLHLLPLLRALAGRTTGPPQIHLTLIDVAVTQVHRAYCIKHTSERLEHAARELGLDAGRLSIDLVCTRLEDLDPTMVAARPGYTRVVNCTLRLGQHLEGALQMTAATAMRPIGVPSGAELSAEARQLRSDAGYSATSAEATACQRLVHFVRALRPAVCTLVEFTSEGGTEGASGRRALPNSVFLTRFMETIHHYVGLFEALDASVGLEHAEEQRAFERSLLGQAIVETVACQGHWHKAQRAGSPLCRPLSGRFLHGGLVGKPMGAAQMALAQQLLQLYKGDFGVSLNSSNTLTLMWKGKPVLAASSWQC